MNAQMTVAFVISFALLTAGCGGSTGDGDASVNPGDLGHDMAGRSIDANGRDLAPPIDLAVAGMIDLAPAPDFTSPPDLILLPDLQLTPGDLAGLGPCPANAGYGGPNGKCGQQGMCGGHTFALDCDGKSCVCSIDMLPTNAYVEMNNSCNNIGADWGNICGF